MAKLTIRQQWIAYITKLLEEMVDPATGKVWNNVMRCDLDDVDGTELPACAIDEGDEIRLQNLWPFVQKSTKLFIEFRFENLVGDDPYDMFNYYLGLLQKTLYNDLTLGGFAYNVQEVGNTPRIVGRNDTRPGGVLIIEVFWKVRDTNPYSNTHEDT